jgi:hypothetical protein
MRASLVLVLLAGTASADGRPWHGSVSGGPSLVLTGAQDDRLRFDVTVDVKPASRLGALLAWRGFDGDRRGLVTGGIVYEGAAARPRLIADLHADAGADLDARAAVVGGGVRFTLAVGRGLGVGVVLDTGGYLVLDGVDDLRLQLQTSVLAAVRW